MTSILEATRQYRAHCEDCRSKFDWRASKDEAEADADQHQIENEDHIVNIDEKTTQLRRLNVRQRK